MALVDLHQQGQWGSLLIFVQGGVFILSDNKGLDIRHIEVEGNRLCTWLGLLQG